MTLMRKRWCCPPHLHRRCLDPIDQEHGIGMPRLYHHGANLLACLPIGGNGIEVFEWVETPAVHVLFAPPVEDGVVHSIVGDVKCSQLICDHIGIFISWSEQMFGAAKLSRYRPSAFSGSPCCSRQRASHIMPSISANDCPFQVTLKGPR